ncbi:hypothetical protein BDA96_05G232800 [Sorghum bicolor]|uniref:Uncharacterized protein n=1 Tax=Sorghum bicolor TaxID=4558 RepID=A0A921R0F9_SORBI|nr:hypothetical protein BDA96_05G232800 [Sorghum bicolor]
MQLRLLEEEDIGRHIQIGRRTYVMTGDVFFWIHRPRNKDRHNCVCTYAKHRICFYSAWNSYIVNERPAAI